MEGKRMPHDFTTEIKSLIDISSRIDERIKNIQQNQQESTGRLNQFLSDLTNLSSRVLVIESKNGNKMHEVEETLKDIDHKLEEMDLGATSFLEDYIKDEKQLKEDIKHKIEILETKVTRLELQHDSWQNKLKLYGGLLIQGIYVITVCYILYRLGISTPPIP